MIATPSFADDVTVLALGDSLTQGFGLQESSGFVPQLDRWLEERGVDVTLINGGVSGDTTAGGAARADWSLTPDVDAMIVALGANDMLRGLDPAEARKNIEKIIQTAQGKDVAVLLVGISAPGNFGPDYKEAFDALYPELAAAYDTLLYENFFEGLGSGDPSELRSLFQRDGIHPNSDGVSRIVDGIGPSVIALIQQVKDRSGAK
jgi:acyl-CoA thioesterase-1